MTGALKPESSSFVGILVLRVVELSCSVELSMKKVVYPRGQRWMMDRH